MGGVRVPTTILETEGVIRIVERNGDMTPHIIEGEKHTPLTQWLKQAFCDAIIDAHCVRSWPDDGHMIHETESEIKITVEVFP
jgi:hypothetical protein